MTRILHCSPKSNCAANTKGIQTTDRTIKEKDLYEELSKPIEPPTIKRHADEAEEEGGEEE